MTRKFQDSYSPVAYDIQYDQYGNGRFIPFIAQNFLQSIQIDQNTQGPWSGTMALFDRDESYLVQPATRPGIGSKFQIKWWRDNDVAGSANAPTFIASVMDVKPTYSVEGTGLIIDLTAGTARIDSLNKNAPPREFAAGMAASDIVSAIADGIGWISPIIEPTTGLSTQALRMGGETHRQFINGKILPWAINALNSHYEFYFDANGRPHFHSPQYLFIKGLASNGNKLAREYVAYANMVGEVESFQPHDNSFFMLAVGAGDGIHQSIDSRNGEPVMHVSTIETGVTNISTGVYGVPPATSDELSITNPRKDPDGNPSTRPQTTSAKGYIARTPEESNRAAIAWYSLVRSKSYNADLQVHGRHGVSPGDYVRVRYFVANGLEHYLSGVFQVKAITRSLGSNGWHDTMSLSRFGAPVDGGEPMATSITLKPLSTPPSGE